MVRRVHSYANGGPVDGYQPKFKQAYLNEVAADKASAASKAAEQEGAAQRNLSKINARNTAERRASLRVGAQTARTQETTNAAARAARVARPAVSAAEAGAGRVALRAGAVGLAGVGGYLAGKALNDKYDVSGKIVDAIAPKYDPNAKEKSK